MNSIISWNAQRGMHPVFLTKNFFNWDVCVNRKKKKSMPVSFLNQYLGQWRCIGHTPIHCSVMTEHVVSYDRLQANYEVQFDTHK